MNWKNWPYWLKGGVVGGIVGLILFILFYLNFSTMIFSNCTPYNCKLNFVGSVLFLLQFIFAIQASIFIRGSHPALFGALYFTGMFLALVDFIILGIVVGWIVGKFRGKRK